MSEGLPIQIPQEFVNDETVKLLRWFVENDQAIQAGDAVAEIETSKAVVELAAGASGRVSLRTKPGEEVRVGEVIGFIVSPNGAYAEAANAEAEAAAATKFSEASAGTNGSGNKDLLPGDTQFSKKALQLLTERGLAPMLFAGRGLVREQDVAEYLQRSSEARTDANEHIGLEGVRLSGVSLPRNWHDVQDGKVEPAFLESLRKDGEKVASLSSGEKCEAYRKHGAIVEDGVVLEKGSLIIAPQIILGRNVTFGGKSTIQCRERFVVGQFTSFRGDLSVRGGTVILGENVFGGARVQIGGGGNGDPESLLLMGDGTYVGDDVFINICRPVIIGREVFLTQRSILVTHNIGHSILEGYENRFAPIVLEDYSQVGMNSTIYAGTRIGHGSILMSNSYVISSIPPDKLAGGVPARVLREARRSLDRKQQRDIAETVVRDFRQLLERRGHKVCNLPDSAGSGFALRHQGKSFQLRFSERLDSSDNSEQADEQVIWTFDSKAGTDANGCTVMDLLAKRISGKSGVFVETSREFLRKRGIRLEPGPWRYAGGLI